MMYVVNRTKVQSNLRIINTLVFPFEGLLRVLVYARPRYLRLKAKHTG